MKFAIFINVICKFSSNCKNILNRDYFELLKFASKNAKTLRHQKKQLTLFLFAKFLNQTFSKNNQHTLNAFDLFDLIIDFNEYVIEKHRLFREKLTLTNLSKKIDVEWIKLNIDQLKAIENIINAMRENDHNLNQLFFLDDFESTKKIFVQNIVMTKFRFEKFIVLVVAFFDITITLLNDDQIAHARFKISFDSNFQSLCDIDKNTNRVEFIKQVKFIFWDEIFMQRKWDMIIVNRIIFDLLDVFEIFSFESKMICFYEDFKQTLLVCSNKKKMLLLIRVCKESRFD